MDIGRWWAIYFCFLVALPALIASLILPSWLIPLSVIFSGFLAYTLFKGVQDRLFEMTPQTAYFYLNLPFYFLILLWAWGLIELGHHELVPRCVSPVILLLVVCIWPVYRLKSSRKERRVPFESVYLVFGGLVLIHQGFILVSEVYSWFTA